MSKPQKTKLTGKQCINPIPDDQENNIWFDFVWFGQISTGIVSFRFLTVDPASEDQLIGKRCRKWIKDGNDLRVNLWEVTTQHFSLSKNYMVRDNFEFSVDQL